MVKELRKAMEHLGNGVKTLLARNDI